MSTLQDYAGTFDIEPGYLNWAHFGPISPHVRDEAVAHLELLAAGRETGISHVEQRQRDATALIGELLGAEQSEVVLQPSATYGIAHAVYGVTGGVIASPNEFPSIPITITRAASLGRVVPQWIDPAHRFVTPDAVASALDETSSAVAVSLIDFRTGYRADLEAIREVIGDDRLLIVDATQAFGTVTAAWEAADVVVGHGYKWLRAGRGTGFARYSHRARIACDPILSGITGTESDEPYGDVPQPAADARAFTVSRPDPLAAVRLTAAVAEVRDAGVEQIEKALAIHTGRVIEIADAHGIEVITPREPERRGGIVALSPGAGRVGRLGALLANAGVGVTVRSGIVRVSPHVGTDDETFDMFDRVCAELAQS